MTTKSYRKLTLEDLEKIAKKYKTKRQFYDNDPSAFVVASRAKRFVPLSNKKENPSFIGPIEGKIVSTLDDICTHMYKGKFKWSKAMIINAAKEFKTRTEFSKGNKSAYTAARDQGLVEEACAHMPKRKTRSDKKTEGGTK